MSALPKSTGKGLLRFDPSIEQPEEDEQETIAELGAAIQKIRETTYKDSGHAIRSVHAKSHALEAELAQGMFAKPGSYPTVMRFSTIPCDTSTTSFRRRAGWRSRS